jgi:hypothetical protein
MPYPQNSLKRMLWTGLLFFVEKTKTNCKSFSVGQNLVIFQTKTHTKTRIFATLFFDPTIFLAGNRQTAKTITSAIPNNQNIGQKHFHHILIRISGENPKCYTPPTMCSIGGEEMTIS